MKKRITYLIAIFFLGFGIINAFEAHDSYAQQSQVVNTQTAVQKTNQNNTNEIVKVKPLDIIANPQAYLNQSIKMEATFDKFSTLGLDYTPAMRKSEDYIGILIRRDDITDYVMPLPEMKIFLPRKTAEKYIDLETGDKIEIEGKVFSTAMGDAWIDITKLTVISSKKPIKVS